MRALLLTIIAALLLPAGASAATVASVKDGTLAVVSGSEVNEVNVTIEAGFVVVEDYSSEATASAGCRQDAIGALCPRASVKRATVDVGRGSDKVTLGLEPDGPPVAVSGGAGRDNVEYILRRGISVTLDDVANDGVPARGDNIRSDVEDVWSRSGDDRIAGNGAGNDIDGGPGRDALAGGAGDDIVRSVEFVVCLGDPERDCPLFPDAVECGPGDDVADADRLDTVARDCEVVARESVLEGTPAGDRIRGFRPRLKIVGRAGADRITGQGTDRLYGGSNDDVLRAGWYTLETNALNAGTGNDTVIGNRRRDVITAGTGNDSVRAGRGRDAIHAGPGVDRVSAGPGDDSVVVSDPNARRDRVSCGSGRDRVSADQRDVVARDCERVRRRSRR